MSPQKFVGSKGQALLITVLVMVVVLTVGLAVVARSIVQVKTASDEASSEKAFSAAEAGIDQVLKTGSAVVTPQPLGNNASIGTVSITNPKKAQVLVNNNTLVLQDDGADVWLSPFPTSSPSTYVPWNGYLVVYWGTASSPCSDAALEISIISEPTTSPASYSISRYAYDPCSTRISGVNGNNFSSVGTGGILNVNGQTATYNYSAGIPITNGLLARVTPLYTDTIVGVKGYTDPLLGATQTLPSQGQIITSTGSSGNTERKITYFQGYDSVPSELFYSLFSAQ